MTNCIGSILHLEILPSSPRLWMDAWIVARECLTECSQTRLLLPGISLLSLLLLLLVTVCKKGSKTVEPISVPSVLKAAVCGIWRVSLMSSLLPGSHRQEVLCSQVPQRTQCNVFFIVFCLPAQSNLTRWPWVWAGQNLHVGLVSQQKHILLFMWPQVAFLSWVEDRDQSYDTLPNPPKNIFNEHNWNIPKDYLNHTRQRCWRQIHCGHTNVFFLFSLF